MSLLKIDDIHPLITQAVLTTHPKKYLMYSFDLSNSLLQLKRYLIVVLEKIVIGAVHYNLQNIEHLL